MNIAFFSTQKYELPFFEQSTRDNRDIKITYFEQSLSEQTAILANGFDAICVFVNDTVNATVIEQLASQGINTILLRCAGFNNVDLTATKAHNLKVLRVPAYSP